MRKLATCALVLCLTGGTVFADGLSISLGSDDERTTMGPRLEARDARLAIRTRDRSAMLLLLEDTIAIQLTDAALEKMKAESKSKDTGFLEELLAAGVKLAVGKSVQYPIASIRSAELRDGALRFTSDQNKSVFTDVKVNGNDILRDFTKADAERFLRALKARKSAR